MGRVHKPMVPNGDAQEFFDRLHDLHAVAGRPSMRELQRRTRSRLRPNGINSTTIHEVFSRPRPARWETVRAVVAELGGDPDEFAGLWRAWQSAELSPAGQPLSRDRPADPPGPDGNRPVPRQLPADVVPFVGRDRELAELTALAGRVAITAVTGAAGIGKTALAVHWAHTVADRFPDGHLYADLRGFDPDPPLAPGQVLAMFLRTLNVPGGQVPDGEAECAAWYRSLLAGRRMLIVLDNAHDAEQVRPLLPGTATCPVLVTSRDSLAGLVARHGATRIALDPLRAAEAAALVRELIGPAQGVRGGIVRALVEIGGRLPLALRTIAELVAGQSPLSAYALMRDLADDRRVLDLLTAGGDPRTALGSVFSWSVQHLPADAARLFRLLGRESSGPFDRAALTALAPGSVADVRRLTDILVHAHLIERIGPDRFAIPRLLAVYAASLESDPLSGVSRVR